MSLKNVKILIGKSKETPIYLYILFAVLMELRKQEISGIKYSDIDFVNCNKELDDYISTVKPRVMNTTIIDVSDLSANKTCLEVISKKTNGPIEVTNLATNLDFLKDL